MTVPPLSHERVLVLCDTYPENPFAKDRLPAIRAALESLGTPYRVMDIYHFHSERQAHRVHALRGRAGDGFFARADLQDLNRKMLRRITEQDPGVVLFCTASNFLQFLEPGTVRALRSSGILTVGFLGDDEFQWAKNRFVVPLFDVTVAYVKSFAERYNRLGAGPCYYLPSSAHVPKGTTFGSVCVAETDKDCDVLFVGSPFSRRPQLLAALRAQGIRVSIYGGAAWKRVPGLRDCYRGFLPNVRFDAAVRRARVFLACLEDHITGSPHMNTKIWDAARNGVFCVSTYYAPLYDEYGFEEDREIVTYRDEADLVRKVRRYLSSPAERNRVARALFGAVAGRLAYESLYCALFRYLASLPRVGPDAMLRAEAQPAVITIINAHRSVMVGAPGLAVLRYRGRHQLLNDFDRRVRTDFVIFRRRGACYDPYLPRVASILRAELTGQSYLMQGTASDGGRRSWLAHEVDCVLWRREAFRRFLARPRAPLGVRFLTRAGSIPLLVVRPPGSVLLKIINRLPRLLSGHARRGIWRLLRID